ncbi:hypothetical protein MTP99_015138 [Tenebrio molitor]|nr:hypothetical protein MTP99_015138 [Tenebrio molitor]
MPAIIINHGGCYTRDPSNLVPRRSISRESALQTVGQTAAPGTSPHSCGRRRARTIRTTYRITSRIEDAILTLQCYINREAFETEFAPRRHAILIEASTKRIQESI